jgi:phage terminase large subunit-like protein
MSVSVPHVNQAKFAGHSLNYWRRRPIKFIETVLINPESGQPFELLPAERAFLEHAFTLRENGKLVYNEWLYSCPKKSGKTTFAALILITAILLYGGAFPECFCLANDREQAQSRVFEMCRRIITHSPLLRADARMTADKITFPAFNATINAIASDAGSAAGSNAVASCFDELWAYTSERARRLWDEMTPPPTRKVAFRLTVTYAGYEGESLLLQELYDRGKAQPSIGDDLHAGDGMLMFWSHKPVAPWQDDDWARSMRRERASAYQREFLNEFAAPESQFVDMGAWDACVQLITPVHEDRRLHVWAGVDASTKRDSTALVAVTFDKEAQCARLVQHRIFMPSPDNPIQFDQVEATLVDWHRRYRLRKCLFDPMQMESTAQRLTKAGVPIESFPQTLPNLTAATSNLFDLIQARRLALYADANMRLAASRAILHESVRGFRIDKLKQAHKIDVIVALAMACHAAVQGQNEPSYDPTFRAFQPGFVDEDAPQQSAAAQQEPPERPQCNGDWWRSMPRSGASTAGPNDRLRELYSGLSRTLRHGPPWGQT